MLSSVSFQTRVVVKQEETEPLPVCCDESASMLLLEKEALCCAESRTVLRLVIEDKTAAQECFECERIAHNELLQRELRLDTERMKILMKMRRTTLRETTHT